MVEDDYLKISRYLNNMSPSKSSLMYFCSHKQIKKWGLQDIHMKLLKLKNPWSLQTSLLFILNTTFILSVTLQETFHMTLDC